jgi:hypothetical protein
LTVVGVKIFFFLAFSDANASCGFKSKELSSALGHRKRVSDDGRRGEMSNYSYSYLFIFGVDEYGNDRKPVEHICEDSSN